MRTWLLCAVASAVTGCLGTTIEAGTNDAGVSRDAVANADAESGPTIIASEIQLTPTTLVSDGTTLFWVSSVGVGGPVSSMPADGGTISSPVPGMIGSGFLAVDDVNVYYMDYTGTGGIFRAPKEGGGTPTLVNDMNDAGWAIATATTQGGNAYWVENAGSPIELDTVIKSAPLQGGSVSTLANFEQSQTIGDYGAIGVTSTTVFLAGGPGPNQVASFPLSAGVVDGGVPAVVAGASQGCEFFVSDTDAVYCDANGYIARIASDGTTVTLGTVITSLVLSNATTGSGIAGAIAIDDTYVYWVDGVTVGTIMRVPKTGGTATVIARDTNPVAIAADSNAVYWSDQGGNIMRLAK